MQSIVQSPGSGPQWGATLPGVWQVQWHGLPLRRGSGGRQPRGRNVLNTGRGNPGAKACFDRSSDMGEKSLFPGSSSTLEKAAYPLQSIGFRHVLPEDLRPSGYARADVFMAMQLNVLCSRGGRPLPLWDFGRSDQGGNPGRDPERDPGPFMKSDMYRIRDSSCVRLRVSPMCLTQSPPAMKLRERIVGSSRRIQFCAANCFLILLPTWSVALDRTADRTAKL